jgi:hypothetical protein
MVGSHFHLKLDLRESRLLELLVDMQENKKTVKFGNLKYFSFNGVSYIRKVSVLYLSLIYWGYYSDFTFLRL